MDDELLTNAAYTLTHHGVKGMKWGVRKDQHREYSAKATTSTKNKIQRLQAQVTLARNTSRGVKIKTKRKLDEKFNKYAGNQSVKFNDLYFNSLKSKGYTALIDDNDAGVWSRKPTILLSPKQTVKVTSVQQLTADDINRAQRAVMKNQRLNDSYARRSK